MTTAEREQQKYRRMWAFDQYHNSSPGERVVQTFLQSCRPSPGETVADVGAGTGRAGKKLAETGLVVTLLDCCPEANETSLPCREVILWDLPSDLPRFDWIYCVDVLEHIPTEYVEQTLRKMARITGKGGYLQVCCVPDNCGKMIGETLHLTVQPMDWWAKQIQAHWPIASQQTDGTYSTFILRGPYGE